MKGRKPHILITNDDGIDAPGIKHLWRALHDKAHLTIVAPDREQSGKGLSITVRQPLIAKSVPWEKETPAWKVEGSPADCVKLATSVLVSQPIDLIVSGINLGSNHGRNVLYSGTVGATIEGALRGIPGIAFSCCSFLNPLFHVASKFVPGIVDYVLNNPLDPHTLLNVNFPTLPEEKIQGLRLARQGKQYWADEVSERNHPVDGSPYYWMGCKLNDFEEHEESDVVLLEQGYITAVPINVADFTDYQQLKKNKESFAAIFPINVTVP